MCTRVALHPHGGWKLFQGGNTTITSTGPLLHCPALLSGIWPIFTIQRRIWKMPLYHRGLVRNNYSKLPVVIMVHNPAPLVDTQHCQKPVIIPLRLWPVLNDLPLSTPLQVGPIQAPTIQWVTHLPITLYIHQGILYLLGLVLPLGMVILLEVHLDFILSTHSTLMIHDHLMPFSRWVALICPHLFILLLTYMLHHSPRLCTHLIHPQYIQGIETIQRLDPNLDTPNHLNSPDSLEKCPSSPAMYYYYS